MDIDPIALYLEGKIELPAWSSRTYFHILNELSKSPDAEKRLWHFTIDGGGTIKTATAYVMVSRMENLGLINSRVEMPKQKKGGPQRFLQITEKGQTLLNAYKALLLVLLKNQ